MRLDGEQGCVQASQSSMHTAWLALVFALTASLAGCSATRQGPSSPYASQSGVSRNPVEAERLCREAADFIDSDPHRAESLLRQALSHDLFHGPSHNNLGILYLNRGQLYEASAEFEWARKLMPGHPDPRVNLALTLERAGRSQEAIEMYRTALSTVPEHYPALLGLTRLELMTGAPSADTADHLRTISLRSSDPIERDWARSQLLKLGS